MKFKLYLDLIPKTTWYKNARDIMSVSEWNKIKKEVYKKNNYKCSICNGAGKKHPVEAHERWTYNYDTKIQKMVDIIPLCPSCHLVTHFGLALTRGKEQISYNHLKKVNKAEDYEIEHIIEKGFSDWEKRSKINWTVDISYIIENYNDKISDITRNKILSNK